MNLLFRQLVRLGPEEAVKISVRDRGNADFLYLQVCTDFTGSVDATNSISIPREQGIDAMSLLVDRILNYTLLARAIIMPCFLWCAKIEALIKNPNSPIHFLGLNSSTPELEITMNQIIDTNSCRLLRISYPTVSPESEHRRKCFETRQKKLIPLQNLMLSFLSIQVYPKCPMRMLPVELVRMLARFFIKGR